MQQLIQKLFSITLLLILLTLLAACALETPPALPTPAPAGTAPVATTAGSPALPTTPDASGLVEVWGIEVHVLESSVNAVVRGNLPDACSFIEQATQEREGTRFVLTLTLAHHPNQRCAPQPTPFEQVVPLDVAGLPGGLYEVAAHGTLNAFTLPGEGAPEPTPADPTTCTYAAEFVADVTMPDGSTVLPAILVEKSWRVRNTGSCAWQPPIGVAQVNYGGSEDDTKSVPINEAVQPGTTVELTSTFTTPEEAGRYMRQWVITEGSGQRLGVGPSRAPLYADYVVAPGAPDPNVPSGTITGWVWQDDCRIIGGEGGEGMPSGGCVVGEDGVIRADGIANNGEIGIAGVFVELLDGTCTENSGAVATFTDEQGEFVFTNIMPGSYCVAIRPLHEHNVPILLPGDWTFPDVGVGSHNVTVAAGETTRVEFGWDYQLQ